MFFYAIRKPPSLIVRMGRKSLRTLRWWGLTSRRPGDLSQVRLSRQQKTWSKAVFAQHGEDLIIHRLLFKVLRLDPKKAHWYVDVGAYHPFDHSMTAHLHLLGWQGMAFDVSRTSEAAFSRWRPATSFIRAAVGDGSAVEVEARGIFYGDAGITSRTFASNKIESQKTIRISEALDEADVENIEFLSIDVEGAESAVLRGLDFARHRPVLIAVEIHGIYNLLDVQESSVANYLLANDYFFVAASVINFFFASKLGLEAAGRL